MIYIKPKHHSKDDRYKEATDVLEEIGASVTYHNQGIHLVIEDSRGEVHYWPTTGKWRVPSTGITWNYETRFLSGLLTYMGVEHYEI